jgi:hypothetical protein
MAIHVCNQTSEDENGRKKLPFGRVFLPFEGERKEPDFRSDA